MSPTNGSVAPVCPVSRSEPVPGMPGVVLPFVPKAIDLPTAIAAANQANRLLQTLFGQPPLNNMLGAGAGQPFRIAADHVQWERWEEKTRRIARIRFYARDRKGTINKNQWIDVERITYIRWHDKVQKLDLEFKWPYDVDSEGAFSKLLWAQADNDVLSTQMSSSMVLS